MFQRILVPTDGSELSSKAVNTALELAKQLGSHVDALSVKEPFPYSAISEIQMPSPQVFLAAQERLAQQRVQTVLDACKAAKVPCQAHTVEANHPWEAIHDHAKKQECDLIVMASHGRKGMASLLLGSETQKVLTHSKVPVLVVR
jgi:nucleotide-binding universal stress UspA family protein